MSRAIVQSSCRKLESALGYEATIRLNLGSDLQEMLEQLEAIAAVIPRAENWFVHEEASLGRVRDAAYRVCRMVDELQEMAVPGPAAENIEMVNMLASRENIESMGKEMMDETVKTDNVESNKRNEILDETVEKIENDESMDEGRMDQTVKKIKERIKGLHTWLVQLANEDDDRRASSQPPPATEVSREPEEKEPNVEEIIAQLSLYHCIASPIILVIRGDEGVGKATMAAMVFEDDRFKCYSRIWINRSCMLQMHEVGKYIISQLASTREEEMMAHGSHNDMDGIKDHLHKLLNGKKVLVVLHDLWIGTDYWKQLKDMLTVRGTSSTEVKVIATLQAHTCDRYDSDVVEIFGLQPHWLHLSNPSACCKSVIKQAATRSEGGFADQNDLEGIAPEVAELSGGIPLAAQILGSLLQFRQYREWRGQDYSYPVKQSLILSYTSMPANLRLCFAYCGFVFRTKREVIKQDLIHQWIAHDLIEPSKSLSSTQLAEQYHRTLWDMSLLQIAKTSQTSAKDYSSATLFIMHEAVRKSAEASLCGIMCVVDKKISRRGTPRTEFCSYAVVFDVEGRPLESVFPDQIIRGLCFFGACSTMYLGDDSFSFARCMRVLELHECSLQKLPESICQLRHLRYLKLSGWSGLVTLPESIGDLINLLHIDLSSCSRLVNLPGSFGKLINLVHISISGCFKIANLPESFGKLIKLVHINLSGSGLVQLPEWFSKLINLVDINTSGCIALVNLPDSVWKLTKLEHINLSGCIALVNLPESFGKLTNLLQINLSGCNKLLNLPGSFGKLTKLVHINLSGCHTLVNLPGSLGKLKKLVHIDLSGCPGLVNLPDSFGKLTNLTHANLSGCPGLVNLPDSFGKLTNLTHANLSGCSGLKKLPQSFEKLTSLEQINLSGCSGLVTLPGSFGNLRNLLHVDLSRCHGLLKLPESFGHLKKLVHLDLSSCSCFEGIQTALDGLTSLQHLNLSRPCCYRAEYSNLKGLKEVLGQFIGLKHLNLSMFLNPLFCNQKKEENHKYIEFISGFSRLEYLDLSHNIFLLDLPESLHGLDRLRTLDLSGCIRFKKVGGWMAKMQSLESIVLTNLESCQFVVGPNDIINKYGQLAELRCKELEITCLERMTVEEAGRIRLADKQNLQKLKLCWTVNSELSVEDNILLRELVPPHSLQYLELHGYKSTCFPSWLTSSSISSYNGLVEVTMQDIPNCSDLPPLGLLLPNLQRVVLRSMGSITRIDAGELSGGNMEAFNRLSEFTIDNMGSLEEFTYYSGGSGEEEFLLPVINELVVSKCPNLSFVPLPPRARKMEISDCNDVMIFAGGTEQEDMVPRGLVAFLLQ